MPEQETDEPRLSAFALARRLVSGLIALAKLEFQHGRQEIGAMLAQARGAAVMFGIALALVFAALFSFTLFLILLVAALLGWPGWVVSLIVTVLLLVIAALLVWRGFRRIKIGPPEETMASVREEVAWAKRLIKRG
ncbi:MAG: phage holin family protein [Chloroflexota bacterium]|nr:phage holin family protein [Chloroflexota bacterium]